MGERREETTAGERCKPHCICDGALDADVCPKWSLAIERGVYMAESPIVQRAKDGELMLDLAKRLFNATVSLREARAALAAAEQERGAKSMTKSDDAVVHILRRVLDEPRLAWYIGQATASLEFLIAAYAEMTGRALVDVKAEIEPRVHGERPKCAQCSHCNGEAGSDAQSETATLAERLARAEELLDLAWGVIVDVRDWSGESPEWQAAAVRWRDRYMAGLSQSLSASAREDQA